MKISTTYFKLKERHIYGSSRVGVRNSDLDVLPLPDKNFSMTTVHYSIGSRTYELSNQLPSVLPSAVGNVLSVISDTAEGSHEVNVIPVFPYSNVISEMRADIRVAQDYSPFGVTLDGRNFVVSERYRYGYQGSEADNEVKGLGNSYTTEFRQLDPRLGRWLTIDPLASNLPWQSPYCSMDNSLILLNDKKGNTTPKEEKKLKKEQKNINKRIEKLENKEKKWAEKLAKRTNGTVIENNVTIDENESTKSYSVFFQRW